MRKPSARPRRLAGMNLPFCLLPVAFVVLIAACSSAPGPSPAQSANATLSATPSAAASAVRPTGSLTSRPGSLTADYSGILSMDAIEGGCPYLQTTDGRKLQVLYPDGWQLQKAPLQLVAPDGTVHSKGGDLVSVSGSEARAVATICQIGPVIRATEVVDN